MHAIAAPCFGNGSGQVRIFTLQDVSPSTSQDKEWRREVGEILGNESEPAIGHEHFYLNARNGTSLLFVSRTYPGGLIPRTE